MAEPDPRITFFDQHAPTWDTEGPPHAEILARLRTLRDRLGLAAGRTVLEVGCGTGHVTAWLAECVGPGRVTAVDFSPGMLAVARERGIAAEFREADVCVTPLGQAEYDLALCFQSLPHFRDIAGAFGNLSRALRPGGRLVILHFESSEKINAFHDSVGPPVAGDHIPPRSVLEPWIESAGLRVAEWTDRDDLYCVIAEK